MTVHIYDMVDSQKVQSAKLATVEPRFNEVAGDRPNLFVKWRVRYIEVFSIHFTVTLAGT